MMANLYTSLVNLPDRNEPAKFHQIGRVIAQSEDDEIFVYVEMSIDGPPKRSGFIRMPYNDAHAIHAAMAAALQAGARELARRKREAMASEPVEAEAQS